MLQLNDLLSDKKESDVEEESKKRKRSSTLYCMRINISMGNPKFKILLEDNWLKRFN